MRALLIFILWLLLGWFFYSMKSNCCSHPSSVSAKSAAVLPGDKGPEKKISDDTAKVISEEEVTESKSVTETEEFTTKANTLQNDPESREQIEPYDYEKSLNIKTSANLSLIPATDESKLDDELKALLERTCLKLSNNLSKVQMVSYAENQNRKMRKIEDFLIRCGLSPGRINFKTSNKENEDYTGKIVFEIVK